MFADETRPFLQGARLTAWELRARRHRDDGHHRQHGWRADASGQGRTSWSWAPTGLPPTATRANKIGTYTVAVLAREHRIPFYVAAPLSTIDLNDAGRPRTFRSRSETRAR